MKHHTTRKSLQEVKDQLRDCGATKYQLTKPEVRELPKVLFKNETIKSFVIGFYEGGYGMLVATDMRIIFLDVMPFGRMKTDDIPYTMVSSTELALGLMLGSVMLYTRPKNYRLWWVKKDNAQDFNDYIEFQMLKHQKEKYDPKQDKI